LRVAVMFVSRVTFQQETGPGGEVWTGAGVMPWGRPKPHHFSFMPQAMFPHLDRLISRTISRLHPPRDRLLICAALVVLKRRKERMGRNRQSARAPSSAAVIACQATAIQMSAAIITRKPAIAVPRRKRSMRSIATGAPVRDLQF
jgi:hypothetical protein